MSVPYGATINAHENMLYFAIIGIIESVAKLIIAIYLTYCTYDRIIVYGFLTMVTEMFSSVPIFLVSSPATPIIIAPILSTA